MEGVKKIKMNWKLLLLLSLSLSVGLFYFSLHQEKLELPSEGWSREVLVHEFKNLSAQQFYENKLAVTPVSSNQFAVVWNEKQGLFYKVIQQDGSMSNIKYLEVSSADVKDLSVKFIDNLLTIYLLQQDTLKRFEVDWQNEKLEDQQIIAENVDSFRLVDNLILVCGKNSLSLIESNDVITSFPGDFKEISGYKDIDGEYHIVTSQDKGDGTKLINYITSKGKDRTFTIYDVKELPTYSSSFVLKHLDIGLDKDQVYIFATIRDYKTDKTNNMLYTFAKNNIADVAVVKMDLKGFAPNPTVIRDMNQFAFLASSEKLSGRWKKKINLAKYQLNGEQFIEKGSLTKTDFTSFNPIFLNLNEENYLVWEDITGDAKQIYFASTNKSIVEMRNSLTKSENQELIGKTFTGLAHSLIYSYLLIPYTLVPLSIAVCIGLIFALNLFERNPEKVLMISVGMHVLTKFILARDMIIKNTTIHRLFPSFLTNPWSVLAVITVIALIALLCLRNYLSNEQDRSLFQMYTFFAGIDALLFLFIFFPYYSL